MRPSGFQDLWLPFCILSVLLAIPVRADEPESGDAAAAAVRHKKDDTAPVPAPLPELKEPVPPVGSAPAVDVKARLEALGIKDPRFVDAAARLTGDIKDDAAADKVVGALMGGLPDSRDAAKVFGGVLKDHPNRAAIMSALARHQASTIVDKNPGTVWDVAKGERIPPTGDALTTHRTAVASAIEGLRSEDPRRRMLGATYLRDAYGKDAAAEIMRGVLGSEVNPGTLVATGPGGVGYYTPRFDPKTGKYGMDFVESGVRLPDRGTRGGFTIYGDEPSGRAVYVDTKSGAVFYPLRAPERGEVSLTPAVDGGRPTVTTGGVILRNDGTTGSFTVGGGQHLHVATPNFGTAGFDSAPSGPSVAVDGPTGKSVTYSSTVGFIPERGKKMAGEGGFRVTTDKGVTYLVGTEADADRVLKGERPTDTSKWGLVLDGGRRTAMHAFKPINSDDSFAMAGTSQTVSVDSKTGTYSMATYVGTGSTPVKFGAPSSSSAFLPVGATVTLATRHTDGSHTTVVATPLKPDGSMVRTAEHTKPSGDSVSTLLKTAGGKTNVYYGSEGREYHPARVEGTNLVYFDANTGERVTVSTDNMTSIRPGVGGLIVTYKNGTSSRISTATSGFAAWSSVSR